MDTKELFQVLLLLYEAEIQKKILDTSTIIREPGVFKPVIIGQLSFNVDSEIIIKLNETNEAFTKDAYTTMVNVFFPELKTLGVYKLFFQDKFLKECIIKFNPKLDNTLYTIIPKFEFKQLVLPTKEDILKQNYTRETLESFDLTKLKAIFASLKGKEKKSLGGGTLEEKKKLMVNVILEIINQNKLTNALMKHWPVIENNASWMKVFDRLKLNPDMKVNNIYKQKKDDENYLKCLGYIGILLDHLDRAEPLPTDLYGKCLNLSERIF